MVVTEEREAFGKPYSVDVEVCDGCGRTQDVGAKERVEFGKLSYERVKSPMLVFENRYCFKCTKYHHERKAVSA